MAEANPTLPLVDPAQEARLPEAEQPRRTRTRPRRRKMRKPDRESIVDRVIEFYRTDNEERQQERNKRLQLHAKVRNWVEDDPDGPWPGSSNIAYPDIARTVEQTQDSLVNAALGTRPTVVGRALSENGKNGEKRLTQLLDVQFYEENPGEVVLQELAEAFANEEGGFVCFVPWIEERRAVCDLETYPPMPDNAIPVTHLKAIAQRRYPSAEWNIFRMDEDGWSWRVRSVDGKETRDIEFYTKDELPDDVFDVNEELEMEVRYVAKVFDGPRALQIDWDDCFAPPRSANLQIPGPANPDGATHVILRDYPTVDEILRLYEDGTYDSLTRDDVEFIKTAQGASREGKDDFDAEKTQKDVMQGAEERTRPKDGLHRTYTRLTCFDIYDHEDGRGAVDMIWTVLEEPRLLCRAKELTTQYPVPEGMRPERPLAEAQYLPVKGRRYGRSLPELMEGLHDYNKALYDQIRDLGDIALAPFFFYRPSSSQNPEITTISPGEGYPMENPQDLFFPQINVQGGAFAINLLTKTEQLQDKLTTLGDLSQGRVPAGSSSALRTSGNLQALIAQGEARPERVLRRFFMGVTQIYALFHRLNHFFLPSEKKIRAVGLVEPGDDVYVTIRRQEIREAQFDFTFVANVQNANVQARQEALIQAYQIKTSPIALQMGTTTPDGYYRLERDLLQALGVDPDQYGTPPSPAARQPKITAEKALMDIMMYRVPVGMPAEGSARDHFTRFEKLLQTPFTIPETGQKVPLMQALGDERATILGEYMRSIATLMQEEERMQQQALAARRTQAQLQQGTGGNTAPGAPPDTSAPPVQGGELIDESLPGAGGGANSVQ